MNANYGDPNYQGEPTDVKLAQGPVEERHCTDILCCMIFVAYCVVMVYIAM